MPAVAAQKTVLVADDTAFVRDRFKAAIEGAGHQAVTAKSAPELLARLREELPRLDLVVLDLKLPQTTGVEIVREIRRLDNGRLPILIFSGTVTNADEVRAPAALGVAGYVNEYSSVQNILPALAPHLFPDSFNRRGSPRVVLGIPIAYRFGNTIATALTLNLSRGGIAIRTTSPLQKDASVKLRLKLPGASKEMNVDTTVCWSDTRSGMGLRFERVDPEDQRIIDAYVDAHFFQSRKG